ncbi:MAG TPA: ABATE domain-containing protein [Alphaproteobacteria bacterium]|nr:ABATE domain-containing protein [Alphaproteobacteria bacterium]
MAHNLWTADNFLGGALCLDFANTISGRRSDRPRELLHEPGDVFSWAAAAGEICEEEADALKRRAAEDAAAAEALMAAARGLREAVYAVFSAVAAGRTPPAAEFARLDGSVADALGRLSLTPTGDGYVWSWRDAEGGLGRPLWAVARSAGELLTTADPRRLRECGGPDCAWLFVDTSKNAKRRWCDMRFCGNRAKAHRHYRRTRADAE